MAASAILAPTQFNMMLSQHSPYANNLVERDLRLQAEYKRVHEAYTEVRQMIANIERSEAEAERIAIVQEARAKAKTDVANQMQVAKKTADKLIDEAKQAAAQIIQEAKAKSEAEDLTVIRASKEQADGGDNSDTSISKETARQLAPVVQLAMRKEPPALTTEELAQLWDELRPASSPQPGCSPWQVRLDFMAADNKAQIEAAVYKAQASLLGPNCQVALHIVGIKPMAVVDVTGTPKTANAVIVVVSPSQRGPLSVVERLLMNTVHDALLKGAHMRKQETMSNRPLRPNTNIDSCFSALALHLSKSKDLNKIERALCPTKRMTEPPTTHARHVTKIWVDEQLEGMLKECPNFKDKLCSIKAWCKKNVEVFRAKEVIDTPTETLQRLMKVVLERHYLQAEGNAKNAVRSALIRVHEGNVQELE